jgi:hypothetical protein
MTITATAAKSGMTVTNIDALPKWRVVAEVPEECQKVIGDCYENFLDRCRYQYAGLTLEDAALSFCEIF